MFGTFIKKKLSDNQVANIFINALYDSVDNGFSVIDQWINEDPAFVESPKIDLSLNFQWTGLYKYTGDHTDGGYVISFSSDIDFVNALIFKINGDNNNFNIYYQKYIASMN